MPDCISNIFTVSCGSCCRAIVLVDLVDKNVKCALCLLQKAEPSQPRVGMCIVFTIIIIHVFG